MDIEANIWTPRKRSITIRRSSRAHRHTDSPAAHLCNPAVTHGQILADKVFLFSGHVQSPVVLEGRFYILVLEGQFYCSHAQNKIGHSTLQSKARTYIEAQFNDRTYVINQSNATLPNEQHVIP